MSATPHIGRNICRIRELKSIKQEALADLLGTSQQAVSRIESSENVDEANLSRVAKALGMTPDAIKNFDEEKTIMNIQNNYEGSNQGANNVSAGNYQCTFNPLDKLMEALEENKRLYEALLKEKEERIKLLEGRK
jgi:transcriptional regulator with XRE-family HTH domain